MDIQILRFTGSARISAVDTHAADRQTLVIEGGPFLRIRKVRINGLESPEFVVQNRWKIYAKIPSTQVGNILTSLDVLSDDVRGSPNAKAELDISVSRQATGLTKLVQTFLTVLFARPGSDIFHPELGGGLRDLVLQSGKDAAFRAFASQSVTRTTAQIRKQQASLRLPPGERLSSAELESARYDRGTGTVFLRVRLSSVEGDEAVAEMREETQ